MLSSLDLQIHTQAFQTGAAWAFHNLCNEKDTDEATESSSDSGVNDTKSQP
jgi:hypothetical protein